VLHSCGPIVHMLFCVFFVVRLRSICVMTSRIFVCCSKAFGSSARRGGGSHGQSYSRTVWFAVVLPLLAWLVGSTVNTTHEFRSSYLPIYWGVCLIPLALMGSSLFPGPIAPVKMIVGIVEYVQWFRGCLRIWGRLLESRW